VKASDIETRLIGQSAKAKKVVQQIKKLCTVRTPVLLVGESGTGKGRWPTFFTPTVMRRRSRWVASTVRSAPAGDPRRPPRPERRRRLLGAAGPGQHAVA